MRREIKVAGKLKAPPFVNSKNVHKIRQFELEKVNGPQNLIARLFIVFSPRDHVGMSKKKFREKARVFAKFFV